MTTLETFFRTEENKEEIDLLDNFINTEMGAIQSRSVGSRARKDSFLFNRRFYVLATLRGHLPEVRALLKIGEGLSKFKQRTASALVKAIKTDDEVLTHFSSAPSKGIQFAWKMFIKRRLSRKFFFNYAGNTVVPSHVKKTGDYRFGSPRDCTSSDTLENLKRASRSASGNVCTDSPVFVRLLLAVRAALSIDDGEFLRNDLSFSQDFIYKDCYKTLKEFKERLPETDDFEKALQRILFLYALSVGDASLIIPHQHPEAAAEGAGESLLARIERHAISKLPDFEYALKRFVEKEYSDSTAWRVLGPFTLEAGFHTSCQQLHGDIRVVNLKPAHLIVEETAPSPFWLSDLFSPDILKAAESKNLFAFLTKLYWNQQDHERVSLFLIRILQRVEIHPTEPIKFKFMRDLRVDLIILFNKVYEFLEEADTNGENLSFKRVVVKAESFYLSKDARKVFSVIHKKPPLAGLPRQRPIIDYLFPIIAEVCDSWMRFSIRSGSTKGFQISTARGSIRGLLNRIPDELPSEQEIKEKTFSPLYIRLGRTANETIVARAKSGESFFEVFIGAMRAKYLGETLGATLSSHIYSAKGTKSPTGRQAQSRACPQYENYADNGLFFMKKMKEVSKVLEDFGEEKRMRFYRYHVSTKNGVLQRKEMNDEFEFLLRAVERREDSVSYSVAPHVSPIEPDFSKEVQTFLTPLRELNDLPFLLPKTTSDRRLNEDQLTSNSRILARRISSIPENPFSRTFELSNTSFIMPTYLTGVDTRSLAIHIMDHQVGEKFTRALSSLKDELGSEPFSMTPKSVIPEAYHEVLFDLSRFADSDREKSAMGRHFYPCDFIDDECNSNSPNAMKASWNRELNQSFSWADFEGDSFIMELGQILMIVPSLPGILDSTVDLGNPNPARLWVGAKNGITADCWSLATQLLSLTLFLNDKKGELEKTITNNAKKTKELLSKI